MQLIHNWRELARDVLPEANMQKFEKNLKAFDADWNRVKNKINGRYGYVYFAYSPDHFQFTVDPKTEKWAVNDPDGGKPTLGRGLKELEKLLKG